MAETVKDVTATKGGRGVVWPITDAAPARPLLKVCTKCHQNKTQAEFSQDSRTSSGFRPACKACMSTADAVREAEAEAYRMKHDEDIRAAKWHYPHLPDWMALEAHAGKPNIENLNFRTMTYDNEGAFA